MKTNQKKSNQMSPKSINNEKEVERKEKISNFAKAIQCQLDKDEDDDTTDDIFIEITNYTKLMIDDVYVDIYVSKGYNYYITNNFIESSSSNDSDNSDDFDLDIKFLEKEGFSTLVELLTHIEEVKETYRFIEHKLVSPIDYEFAKNQRIFFPIPSDKKCCICYDSTKEYTICNHPICIKSRIKCIASNKLCCPVCRESENNITVFPHSLTYTLCI